MLASPSSRSDAGFHRQRTSSFYSGAHDLDYDDSAIACPSDNDHSSISGDTASSIDSLECPESLDASSVTTEEQSFVDDNKENESDSDVIYVETVIVRRFGRPLIELN